MVTDRQVEEEHSKFRLFFQDMGESFRYMREKLTRISAESSPESEPSPGVLLEGLDFVRDSLHPNFLSIEERNVIPYELKRMYSTELGTESDKWWVREANELIDQPMIPTSTLIGEPHIAVKKAEASGIEVVTPARIRNELYHELPLTANRLVGEKQELFLEV